MEVNDSWVNTLLVPDEYKLVQGIINRMLAKLENHSPAFSLTTIYKKVFPTCTRNSYQIHCVGDSVGPSWAEQLKDPCVFTFAYGPSFPYAITFVEGLTSRWITHCDWFQVAKLCLTGRNFLLWRVEYEELAKKETASQKVGRRGTRMARDMWMGIGDWILAKDQPHLSKYVLIQCSAIAVAARRRLLSSDVKTTVNIRQKSGEPFEAFLPELMEAMNKMVIHGDAAQIIIKQMFLIM